MAFALGFHFDETYDTPGWSFELVTDDFDEIIGDLEAAREDEANGVYYWAGARLAIWVKRDNEIRWEILEEPPMRDGDVVSSS